MLIKITEKCSMACSHCVNNAKPNGKHMKKETFIDVLNFLYSNGLHNNMIITGGEPTEHPEFEEFMEILISFLKKKDFKGIVTVTTNGFWILENEERALDFVKKSSPFQLIFQVSTDKRYYPEQLPTHKKIWREKGFILCEDCVQNMYPLGRAKENGYVTNRISSHCFNIRAIAKQLSNPTFKNIVENLEFHGKFCTPAIRIDGGISLGESDYCPKCSHIYNHSDKEIVKSIIYFQCHICDHINKNLPELYKRFL